MKALVWGVCECTRVTYVLEPPSSFFFTENGSDNTVGTNPDEAKNFFKNAIVFK